MTTLPRPDKPLGIKAYGSIGHLPNSRLGPGDHAVNEGQARICTEAPRDKYDTITVQEKLDGAVQQWHCTRGKCWPYSGRAIWRQARLT